ncbi:hypothetical protein AB0B31_30715 [Catellatospora citrea]|uniref:hypothetical protein n=1 Tax=Catellatospora citrea TaxID=53366 RepID=UPI0033D539DC
MSPLPRLRAAALGFALLALALRLLMPFWWGWFDHADDLPFVVYFLVDFVAPLLLATLPTFGGYRLVQRRHARPPADFEITPAGFVAPSSPEIGYQWILWGFLVGGLPVTERSPDGGRHLAMDPFMLVTTGIMFISCAAAVTWWLLRGPRIVLTPEHLAVRVWRTRRFAWDSLAPGGPVPPAPRQHQLALLVSRPGGGHDQRSLPLRWAYVDGTFLAWVIRHYAEHPEHRTAIGTAAELRRLRAALGHPDHAPAAV